MMTRKDYQLIAAALKSARVPSSLGNENKAIYNNGVDNAVDFVARELAKDNPRFDDQKFRAACKVES
jgi:hypothetical protein